MSRIMCMEDCPYHTKTGYCRYSYCDEKPFFLYKDGVYAQIKSSKTVIDKKKICEFLDKNIHNPKTHENLVFIMSVLKAMIADGIFDVDIKEKENRYKDEHIKVSDASEYVFEKLAELGLCHCDKDAHIKNIQKEMLSFKENHSIN